MVLLQHMYHQLLHIKLHILIIIYWKKIWPGTEYTYFGTQSKEIHISKNTTEKYRTLGDAIAANNSPNNIFIIHPGTYIENNPIIIPLGSSIKSIGTAQNTTLIAQNPSSDLIVLGTNCRIFGISLFGCIWIWIPRNLF